MCERREPTEPTGYRVGAVRRLTGLSDHTLRAWERRHGVIRPSRTGGGMRVYSEDDVARLQLLKALTDCGESIGSIAALDDRELRARLALHADPGPHRGPAGRPVRRLALLEPGLAGQIDADGTQLAGVEVVLRASSLDALLEGLADARADVVVVALDALGPDVVAGLRRCLVAASGAPVGVAYAFAPAGVLDRVAQAGGRLLRVPIRLAVLRQRLADWTQIERARAVDAGLREAAAALPTDPTAPPGDRIFGDAALSRLTEARSSLDCECPAHVAEIVRRLVAFEAYSAACASASPSDAELHACLARATGHARSMMENMLARVCEQDGIRF
jgi:DNA-binding transcriptional MerR regulator